MLLMVRWAGINVLEITTKPGWLLGGVGVCVYGKWFHPSEISYLPRSGSSVTRKRIHVEVYWHGGNH